MFLNSLHPKNPDFLMFIKKIITISLIQAIFNKNQINNSLQFRI